MGSKNIVFLWLLLLISVPFALAQSKQMAIHRDMIGGDSSNGSFTCSCDDDILESTSLRESFIRKVLIHGRKMARLVIHHSELFKDQAIDLAPEHPRHDRILNLYIIEPEIGHLHYSQPKVVHSCQKYIS